MSFARNLTKDSKVPSELWQDDDTPAPKLLDILCQVAHFLDELGYEKAFTALLDDAKDNNDLNIDIAEWQRGIQKETAVPLLEVYQQWYDENSDYPTLPDSDDDASDAEESSDDSEDEDEDQGVIDAEAEETSDDGSDADEKPAVQQSGKRKRVLTPDSSSSSESESDSDDSDDSDSSSESDAPPSKKTKVASPAKKVKVESESESDSDSESEDESEGDAKETKDVAADDDSDSESDSSDDAEDSSSESSESAAAKVDDSSEESSSSSEEESSPSPPPKATKKSKKAKDKKATSETRPSTASKQTRSGSLTSSTLDGDAVNSGSTEAATPSYVHPDRLRQVPQQQPQSADGKKKPVVPFSRIPTDQFVDPRFASNEYVSYDYADRAHRDLIITKGKGFTKEKNKKKRGSYRGGAIDLTPKGIKFDD